MNLKESNEGEKPQKEANRVDDPSGVEAKKGKFKELIRKKLKPVHQEIISPPGQ